MERLGQDIRFAFRLLVKDRAFAITTLLTLAVCIGANATIFSVVDSILLKPLPVPEPERLVMMQNIYPRAGVDRGSNGVPDYYDRLRELQVFEEQALYNTRGLTIGLEGNPQRVLGMMATPSLLRMLEANPVQGRIFTEAEGELGNHGKTILTYGYWQEVFGGKPAVGQQLRINGVSHEIVGVLPEGFHFLDPDVKLWIPAAFSAREKSDDSRHSNNWSMVGRLRRGATAVQAQQQLDALNARNMERFPQFREILTNAGFRSLATPLQEDLVRGIRGTLYLLWGGVLFVLLIGVVNVTNLVLVRATGRARELATRHALGAQFGRLVRQLLTETVLLTIAGGAFGLAVGYWGLDALVALGLDQLPRGAEVRMDGRAVAFTLGLALAVGIVVGLVPVLNLRGINLSQAFREESRSGTSSRGTRLMRRALVTAQIGFAFMLLIGAGLLLASFQRVLAIDPGFNPSGVLTARVSPPSARYADDAGLRTFTNRLLERVRGLPGVQQAGVTSSIPFGGDYSDSVILAEDYRPQPGESLISPFYFHVSPGYFEALGAKIVSGRDFADGDTESSQQVVIVDQKLARRFWGDKDPVGRRMYKPESPEDFVKPGGNVRWYTVVGVVSDMKISGLVETETRFGGYYFPVAQQTARYMTLTVRTEGAASSLVPLIRRELAAIDPELPLYGVLTMEERMDESLVSRRAPMVLATAFAGVALFLAAIGIYGVLAYQVSQRSREIGIRMALGSDAWGVFRLILSEGVLLLAVGLGLGMIGAFSIRTAMESQLYGVGALDPTVLTIVATIFAAVALIACVVPARRASRIDPMHALTA
jgi:predicted permease